MEYHLAQVNIARMLAPIDSNVMANFVANLDRINAIAEQSKGFVWRLKDEGNNATSIRVYDDDFIIVNMSVWESTEDLFEYVYKSAHKEVLGRRNEWFERMKDMHMVLWYLPAGHLPTVREATEKLDEIRKTGYTPKAFSFKKRFTEEEFRDYKVT